MTAIAACLSWSGNIHARDRVDRMLRAQSVFGPDNTALEGDDGLALGRNLLRLVPEDRFDRQPVAFGGGRYRLVADLRIDNREELYRLLDLPAAQARTMADSAVLAAAFERWGIEQALSKLVGVFAIVVWDRQERELTLIRDPMGQRPLFYSRRPDFVAVAGMPKGLFALAEVPRELNETRLVEFISCLPHQGSATLYREISRVEPGSLVRLSRDGETTRHWADLADLPEARFGSFEEALEALDEVMTGAVRSQLRSIGGVGSHLSAGLDSSVVTAMAARALAQTGGTLHAFTAGPRDTGTLPSTLRDVGNEVPQARRVAALFPNVHHHVVFNDCQPMREVNARYISVMDETPLNPTNMPWIDGIFDRAKQEGVTTILNGGGGNYTFSAGLGITAPEFLHRRTTLSFLRRLTQMAAGKEITARHAAGYFLRGWLPHDLYLFIKERSGRAARPRTGSVFLQEAVVAEYDLNGRTDRRFRAPDFDGEIGSYFRLFLLLQLDTGTLAKAFHALGQVDARDPTIDLRVVRFCLSVPIEMFTANGSDRAFAKALYRRHLSQQVLSSFFRGRQAADSAGLFVGERQAIAQEIIRATTTNNHLFRATDPSPLLQSLERLNAPDCTAREQSAIWRGLNRYSRLLGISQFLNMFDDRNGS